MVTGRINETLIDGLAILTANLIGAFTDEGPPDGVTIGDTASTIIPVDPLARIAEVSNTGAKNVFMAVNQTALLDKGIFLEQGERRPLIIPAGKFVSAITTSGGGATIVWQLFSRPDT